MALYQYRQDPYGFQNTAQSYQTQRGLTTGSRLSAPEWRGMVSGYNQANYQNALEWARLAEQTRQQDLNRQTQEDAIKTQESAATVKGVGQAAGGLYSGYKMGQDVGLWGTKPATATPAVNTGTPAGFSTNVVENTPTIGGTIPSVTSAAPVLGSAAPATTAGMTTLGGTPITVGMPTLGGTGALTMGATPTLLGAGGAAGALGEGAAAGLGSAAAGTAAAEGAAMGTAGAVGAANAWNPVGWGIGAAMLMASLFGDDLFG